MHWLSFASMSLQQRRREEELIRVVLAVYSPFRICVLDLPYSEFNARSVFARGEVLLASVSPVACVSMQNIRRSTGCPPSLLLLTPGIHNIVHVYISGFLNPLTSQFLLSLTLHLHNT